MSILLSGASEGFKALLSAAPDWVVVQAGERIVMISAPSSARPVPFSDALPVANRLADNLVSIAVEQAAIQGKTISCGAGCGACCRQAAPIGHAEARRIEALVEYLPAERQRAVRARFAEAEACLAQAGLIARLETLPQNAEAATRWGLDYFRLGIPCPFLEKESCSIHAERPPACREYLVTSPAPNCSDPGPDNIARVAIKPIASRLVREIGYEEGRDNWLPLSLALWWTRRSGRGAGLQPVRAWYRRMTELANELAR